MRKHWAVWLVVIHVVITSVFVVKEEARNWDSWKFYPKSWDHIQEEPIPRWMVVVSAWAHLTKPPAPPAPDEWSLMTDIERHLSTAELGYYVIEFPIAALVGWYQHPTGPTATDPTLLPPGLIPGIHRIPMHRRIMVIEGFMISLVAAFWWFVAKFLKRKERFGRCIRIPVLVFTGAGWVCAVACLLPSDWRVTDVVAGLSALVGAMGWLLAAVVCVLYPLLVGCAKLRQKMRA